jgi:hypothetical protein
LDTKEIIKAVILLGLFCCFAPTLGFLLRRSRVGQRTLVAIICFMTTSGVFGAGDWGLTLAPMLYRGHSRGYHFYFIEVCALALICARVFSNWRDFKIVPPGLWLYFAFCFTATLSIIGAPYPSYGLMAALKAVKITLLFIAIFNYLQEEEDLEYVLTCMGFTMAWQCLVCAKMKYLDHIHQVMGTFEHQNSLSMFAMMIGLVFLGVALGPKTKKSNWFLLAYLMCALIIQFTLSRGGLAMFAAGTMGVVGMSLMDKVNRRRLVVLGCLCVVGVVGLAFTFDSIKDRFNDKYNEESANTRKMLNEASRAMVKDHPFGAGWNNFGRLINKPFNYGDHIDHWQLRWGNHIDRYYQKGLVESLYYLILAENGYLSLLLYCAFMARFLWWNARGAITFRTHFLGALSMGMLSASAMTYVQSTLERVLVQPRNLSLWLVLLAATARIEMWRREEVHLRKLEEAGGADENENEEWDSLAVETQEQH